MIDPGAGPLSGHYGTPLERLATPPNPHTVARAEELADIDYRFKSFKARFEMLHKSKDPSTVSALSFEAGVFYGEVRYLIQHHKSSFTGHQNQFLQTICDACLECIKKAAEEIVPSNMLNRR